jgi:hypothetical protein
MGLGTPKTETFICLQVTVHIKGKFECFECTPKAAPKTYPICTLRNTPDKPIHCVVWAKDLLYSRLFGRSDEITGGSSMPVGVVNVDVWVWAQGQFCLLVWVNGECGLGFIFACWCGP